MDHEQTKQHGTKRVALVTGASRGLGKVVTAVLAARGYDLVIGARDAGPLERVAASLRSSGTGVVAVDGDIVSPDVRARLVDAANDLGGLDLLVNNASMLGGVRPLLEVDLPQFGRLFPVNIGAPMALTQLAMPLLTVRRGLVINVTSDAAHGAYPGWGPYGASKAALELLTRTLAAELDGGDVAVALVDPGDMRTAMHQEAFPGEDISDVPLPEVTEPFWHWLVEQDPRRLHGQRLVAQQQDAPWQMPVS